MSAPSENQPSEQKTSKTPKSPKSKKSAKSTKTENLHAGHRKRKREQYLRCGADAFADHELLELLLFYANPRGDTNPVAHRLLDRFGSLQNVLSAPASDLARVDGVGDVSACLVSLVAPLYRRAVISEMKNEIVLDTVARLGDYFMKLFAAETHEIVYQLCLDAKGRRIKLFKISEGCPASVGFDLREILSNTLATNASMVVLAHNHPSGIALPSSEDKAATRQVQEALGTVGVLLADHIIVADNDFVSFRDSHFL